MTVIAITTFKLLPLMYIFELQDILLLLNHLNILLKASTFYSSYILQQLHFTVATFHLVQHLSHTNNLTRHLFFHRLPRPRPRLWNTIPIINLHLPMVIIKLKLKECFWNHFVSNFNDNDLRYSYNLSMLEMLQLSSSCEPQIIRIYPYPMHA